MSVQAMGFTCHQALNPKSLKVERAPNNVPIHTSARYGIGCSTSGRNAHRLTLVPRTHPAFARTSRSRGLAPVRAKFLDDDEEPKKLIPNAEKVYKWVNGRRQEVDSSQILNAEQDKALWSKVVSQTADERETMIDAEFAPPPPRYLKGFCGSALRELRTQPLCRVNSIVDKIRRGKLDLKPAYQREYVWDNKTASRLIESLLLNVPIPTLFFHEVRNGCLEVVDGKQRLTSIWSFILEQFPDSEPFRLTGLEVSPAVKRRTISKTSGIPPLCTLSH
eukprot:1195819-Prorocentrum_minimum.AAC.1